MVVVLGWIRTSVQEKMGRKEGVVVEWFGRMANTNLTISFGRELVFSSILPF